MKKAISKMEEIEEISRFHGLALKSEAVTKILSFSGPYTVFAPVNTAFEKIDQEVLANLVLDKIKLSIFLNYYIVIGYYLRRDISFMDRVVNLMNIDLVVLKSNGNLLLNGAVIVKGDFESENGPIQIIDRIWPSSII